MISPETITQVKERTDVVALVGETVKLVRRGRSFLGLCPFHKEKTPSFHVNAERGMFYCFGCKEAGGAVDFIIKTEGLSFPEAIRWLAERAGIEVAETATDQERREANAARRGREDLYAVNNAAATFFERQLRGSSAHPLAPYAIAELARRELRFPEQDDAVGEAARMSDTLQAFRIGYAPFGWDALATYFRQQGIAQAAAERVGLLVPRTSGSGHYDRFRHRLMFAVSDVMGRVIAFSGRSLPEPTPAEITSHKLTGPTASPASGDPPAKYINSPESPIYTKGEHLFGLHQARQAVRQSGDALLVEGNFDVVALHARGIANVVAPLGTSFTSAQAKLLKRFAPRVTILFDGDSAGRKAALAAHKSCRDGGLDASVAALPKGTDPDEFVRTAGPSGLEKVLKAARGMREFRIQDALDGDAFRTGSLDEQQRRLRAVQEILTEESDPTVRAMVKTYADQISSKLVVGGKPLASLRELELALEGATRRGTKPEDPDSSDRRGSEARAGGGLPHDRARSRSQTEAIPLQMLGALLDFPHLLRDYDVERALDLLDGDAALAVAALRRNLNEHANGTPGSAHHGGDHDGHDPEGSSSPQGEIGVYADEFLAQIAPSIQAFAVGRLASPTFDVLDDARTELLDNARKLSSLSLKRENAVGVEQLQRVEATGDVDKENELLRALDARARKRHGLVPETRLETRVFPGVLDGEPRVSPTRPVPQTPPGSAGSQAGPRRT